MPDCPSTYSNTLESSSKRRKIFDPIQILDDGPNRVCPDRNETNFHIFYYLCDGLAANGKLKEYHLDEFERRRSHRYLSLPSDATRSAEKRQNVERFRVVRRGFDQLGFASDELDSIYKMLAAVLHLGDVELVADASTDGCRVANPSQIEIGKSLDTLSDHENLIHFSLLVIASWQTVGSKPRGSDGRADFSERRDPR